MHNQPGGSPPVFVDRTGRRRRLAVIGGTAMGLGLLTSFALILAGLFFDSPVPLPGWSDDRPAQPIEAGLDGREGSGDAPSRVPSPTTTRTSGPTAGGSPTAVPSAVRPTPAAPATARPYGTDQPGLGDERRNTARPSKSPGKPK
ncbi:hypothetical protein ACIBTV_06260 [Micromonospora sp. NPDC049366]|uniref:hypothetical protein n=1 Tax=Micromonospora sp. NPDC049366 TaxID=3364271 RepID=UPI00378C6E35